MLLDFFQRSSDTINPGHPLALHVWRLNIHVYAGEATRKARVLKGLSRGGWAGMNLSSVSRFEWAAVCRLSETRIAVVEDFGSHDTELDGESYVTIHKGLWIPEADYPVWLDALRAIPPRIHRIAVGEPVPALIGALRGLNWLVSPCLDEQPHILSVQDTENLDHIRALARLSLH